MLTVIKFNAKICTHGWNINRSRRSCFCRLIHPVDGCTRTLVYERTYGATITWQSRVSH